MCTAHAQNSPKNKIKSVKWQLGNYSTRNEFRIWQVRWKMHRRTVEFCVLNRV